MCEKCARMHSNDYDLEGRSNAPKDTTMFGDARCRMTMREIKPRLMSSSVAFTCIHSPSKRISTNSNSELWTIKFSVRRIPQTFISSMDTTLPAPAKPSAAPSWSLVGILQIPMDGCANWISAFKDNGRNESCAWTRLGGGDVGRNRYFQCAGHVGCQVKLRCKNAYDGVHVLRSGEHTEHKRKYDRVNASLTIEEKLEVRKAKTYSGSAGDAMKTKQKEKLDAGGIRRTGKQTGVVGMLQRI